MPQNHSSILQHICVTTTVEFMVTINIKVAHQSARSDANHTLIKQACLSSSSSSSKFGFGAKLIQPLFIGFVVSIYINTKTFQRSCPCLLHSGANKSHAQLHTNITQKKAHILITQQLKAHREQNRRASGAIAENARVFTIRHQYHHHHHLTESSLPETRDNRVTWMARPVWFGLGLGLGHHHRHSLLDILILWQWTAGWLGVEPIGRPVGHSRLLSSRSRVGHSLMIG